MADDLLISCSLRIGGYESERAVLVSETPQNGEILAAVCPNSKTIITAGTSTVIYQQTCVFEAHQNTIHQG